MHVNKAFDKAFTTHGNWKGLSPGNVVVIWLCHVLSQGDHRLYRVEDWAKSCQTTLSKYLEKEVRSLDLSDDRVASILQTLSRDEEWIKFEKILNRRVMRVYNLSKEPIRVDSTSVNGHWEVTKEALFQLGYSKDKRPDLPQIKVNMSTLNPMGLPIVTHAVAGNVADDPLYIPAVKDVKKSIGSSGMLYIGDCQMCAVETRGFIAKGRDFYLCPLSSLQVREEQLDIYLDKIMLQGKSLIEVHRENSNDELIAKGFEENEKIVTSIDGKEYSWTERRLIVRSEKLCKTETLSLEKRLANAQKDLKSLNEKKSEVVEFLKASKK